MYRSNKANVYLRTPHYRYRPLLVFTSRRLGLLSLCALALLVQHGLVLEAAFDHLGVPAAAVQLLLARLGGRQDLLEEVLTPARVVLEGDVRGSYTRR